MADIKFACVGCGQHIACDEAQAGLLFRCPACGYLVRAPDLVETRAAFQVDLKPVRPAIAPRTRSAAGTRRPWFGAGLVYAMAAGVVAGQLSLGLVLPRVSQTSALVLFGSCVGLATTSALVALFLNRVLDPGLVRRTAWPRTFSLALGFAALLFSAAAYAVARSG